MSYNDGFDGTVMGAGTADKWPGKKSMDAALASAAGSRTGGLTKKVVLRSITPLKKTANGAMTLQINDGSGAPIPGFVFEWGTDAVNFMPFTCELNLTLHSGLSFVKDTDTMDHLICDEVLHSVPQVTQHDAAPNTAGFTDSSFPVEGP